MASQREFRPRLRDATHFSWRSSGDADRLAVLARQVWLHTYATPGISQDIARYVLTEITPARMSAAAGEVSNQAYSA